MLKISQSAVSKRIAALERYYDRRAGRAPRASRRVDASRHAARREGHAADLGTAQRLPRRQRAAEGQDHHRRVGGDSGELGTAHCSRPSQHELPEVEFTFHAQRSPIVLDRIRSGEYMVGICTGSADSETDLQSEVLRLEPMVIVPSALSQPSTIAIGDELDGDHDRVALGRVAVDRRRHAAFAVASLDVARVVLHGRADGARGLRPRADSAGRRANARRARRQR